jgi:cardiolipin synthase (CMP-forming)
VAEGARRALIRPSAVGFAGSACLLVADAGWLVLARPPAPELLAAWFGLLLLVGVFLPGLANQVTISRAHLAGPALVYTLLPSRLLELAAVVTLAGVSDLLDGAVARKLQQRGKLGGALDPVVDGLFFGGAAAGLALGGAYPPWLAGVVVARYALPAVAGGLLLLAGRRPELRHTPLGQGSTLLIGLMVGGLALFRGLGWPTDVLLAFSEVAIPLATLATFGNLYWSNRHAFIDR